LQVSFEIHLVYDQTQGTAAVFSWLYDISIDLKYGVTYDSGFSSKYGEFCAFFSQKENSLYTLQRNFYFIFLGCHRVKFHQGKCTNWETYCHFCIKKKRFGVFIPRLVTLVIFRYLCPKLQAKWSKGLHTTEWNDWISQPTKQR